MKRLAVLLLGVATACGHSSDVAKTDAQPVLNVPAPTAAPQKAELALIPRRDIFSAADHYEPRLSFDGKLLAWSAPVNGVPNIWVGPAADPSSAKPVTKDTHRGIRVYRWAYDNKHVIYEQDTDGDEDTHLYVLDVATGNARDATAFQKVKASVVGMAPQKPNSVVVALNRRDPEWEDLFELDLDKATLKPLFENRSKLVSMRIADDYKTVVAERNNEDGSKEVVTFEISKKAKPRTIAKVGFGDDVNTAVVDISADGKTLYMIDSRERDTSALVGLDIASGKSRLIADDARSDTSFVIQHPLTRAPQVAMFEYDTVNTVLLDASLAGDLNKLRQVESGTPRWSGTLDDSQWVVTFEGSDAPRRFYLYDRASGEARFLFSERSALDKAQLAHRRAIVIPARDGVQLVSYLTLPFATPREDTLLPERPLPMVLFVHGGPWARDEEGYDGAAQWLANRGYAVLQVNYRGSTGFGKKFVNLANRGWGGSMHDDLVDAVKWAVDNGVAIPERVGIFGGSYGGFATLTGLTKTPTLFACGVDIVGPSNLETFIAAFPAYWKPYLSMVYERIGDPRTAEGKAFLAERSPRSHVQDIVRPLLIAQGANDPRVKRAESDDIVKELRTRKIPVTYAVFPDEGHGFARAVNRFAFFALAERFLAEHLGGRAEPANADSEGTTMQLVTE